MDEQHIDWDSLTPKWMAAWKEAKLFEAEPIPGGKKYFVTFPYPYMNGYMHLGHFFTLMRVEAVARYKRLCGYNVLFPQGWHCTGSPIENAAKRIREREEKQWNIMRGMGFTDDEIPKFGDPLYWTQFFPVEARKDLESLGLSIDFRRSFITTSLNPYYDKFIRWQFTKLKEGGYVQKGKHPVVWDPKENMPVGDHDRIEGEGETPQEFTLLKFKMKDGAYIVAATLRPETVYGQTNLWVGPENSYVRARVNGEEWILSEQAVRKLSEQEKTPQLLGTVMGKELIGQHAVAPMIHREIPVLPSTFCDMDKGTGIVTSVPSDAPDDWMGLWDLQKNSQLAETYGLDYDTLLAIKPIPIIEHEELGNMAAVAVCKEMKISSQHDRAALERAKKLVYKKGFYAGKLIVGTYAGMGVEKAKDLVKKDLLNAGEADILYELTGKVVSRSLNECVVKIVADQWFMNYADEAWKDKVREALAEVTLYPEKSRGQFEYVIGWLSSWACVREYGLGTKLPWDERWVIESLSDSTIYMAYYTIAHKIMKIPIDRIDNAFFDYVFLGKGSVSADISNAALELRKEFDYWYPLDYRNSGKDLIQNHLAFFLFNHVAIFPKEKWPTGIGVNGWVLVDGQKMSKSLGNFMLLRDLPGKFGVDCSRVTVLSGGEELDDPNWDSAFAVSLKGRLEQWNKFIQEHYWNGVDGMDGHLEVWLKSVLARTILETTELMDKTLFRSALQKIFFEMPRAIRHYAQRSGGRHNKQLLKSAIEVNIAMMSPFAPFYAEEVWESLKKKTLVAQARWPHAEIRAINQAVEAAEQSLMDTIADIEDVLKLAKIEQPTRITIALAPEWKYPFVEALSKLLLETRDIGAIMNALMNSELKAHGGDIAKLVPKFVKDPSKLRLHLTQEAELATLRDAISAISKQFGCDVEVGAHVQHAKAAQALPGRPAVIVE